MDYDVNSDNFVLLSVKHYKSPMYIFSEYTEDIARLKYVKRLIQKYSRTGELRERLILNHIVTLSNVFGIDFTVKALFYKCDKSDWYILKPFLVFLNYLPDEIRYVNGETIITSLIPLDQNVIESLRSLVREANAPI